MKADGRVIARVRRGGRRESGSRRRARGKKSEGIQRKCMDEGKARREKERG